VACWPGKQSIARAVGSVSAALYPKSVATNEPGRVRRWWDEFTDANIAMLTGIINRFFVWDIDS
jgi:hypothetical protein